jgi:hypothetical protein
LSVNYGRHEGINEVHRTGNFEDDKGNRGTSVLAVADALGGTGSQIPTFRYSAALARWTEKDMHALEKTWASAFRQAWRTGKSTPEVTFWAPRKHGWLGCLSAQAIVTQEVIGLMRQSAELEDDLKRVGKYELRGTVTRIREICQPCIQEHEHAVGGPDTRGRRKGKSAGG